MYSDIQRVATYLQTSISEMELIEQMAGTIHESNQFGYDITGMTIFRACSMSLQYITENFIKIRNLATESFFASYRQILQEIINTCIQQGRMQARSYR